MAPNKAKGRAFVYGRVSSAEQALGTSLEDQKARGQSEAKRQGAGGVQKFFIEAEGGGSEKAERREQLKALMREVREGDRIFVDKIDRWSRDPEFHWRSVRELRERGVSIFFVAEQIDPSTPQGEMAFGMWVTFARSEHRRIRERTVGTRELLQTKGYYTAGHPPFGYRRQPNATDRLQRNLLVVVPEEAAIINQVYRRYVKGDVSYDDLLEEFELSRDEIVMMLKRRTYLGEVRSPPSAPGKCDGEWIKGLHEPILDRGLFERVQKVIAERRNGGPRPRANEAKSTSHLVLKGLARCAVCGGKMSVLFSAARARPDGAAYDLYYVCVNKQQGGRRRPRGSKNAKPCPAIYVRTDDAEAMAEEAMQVALGRFADELGKPLKVKKGGDPRPNFAAKRTTLMKRRRGYEQMRADGDISKESFRTSVAEVDAAIAKLDADEAALETPTALEDPKARAALLKQIREIERACVNMPSADLRAIYSVFVTAVRMQAKGTWNGGRPNRSEVQPLKFDTRSEEEVHDRLELVRDLLLKSLGRAPSQREVVDSLFSSMAGAALP